MSAIICENLCKEFNGTAAVKNLSLTINEGEIFSLLGVNGAGKTTTVKMLTTILRPTSGDAFIYGNSIVKEGDKAIRYIDVSFQETSVARKLTVKENIEFYARLCGMDKREIKTVKDQLYTKFGFKGVENKRAEKLSGGWQRKLSIALALIKKPKVLFLDEPTLGLDVIARRELWKVIKSLKGETTVILTTHYMEEVEELADRVGIMDKGELLFCGTKEELYALTGEKNVENAFIKTVRERTDEQI